MGCEAPLVLYEIPAVVIAILMEMLVHCEVCIDGKETRDVKVGWTTTRPNAKHRALTPAGHSPHVTCSADNQCNRLSHPLANHYHTLHTWPTHKGLEFTRIAGIYFYGMSRGQIRGAIGIETFD